MPDKGISAIKYNFLNLPVYLNVNKFGNEDVTINTKYRADGTRLRKENTTVSTGFKGSTTIVNSTDYLDGFQYFSSRNFTLPDGGFELMSDRAMQPQTFSVAERKAPMPSKTADLQFFPTAEGFYDYQKDQYIYQHRDHLGNVRVSYGRNSSGVLEILDNNDYYPFGLNHLKSGTAFFGQGSYKSYKYSSKELQETGMYSYGWRDYMPDIGRWNGIDQLAEKYLSTSTYAYVANNPVSYADVDGRWFDQDGHIIDTTGQTYGFLGSSFKPKYATNFLGVNPGQGGGGGNYIPFGSTKAYSDLMNAFYSGGTGGLLNSNGYLSYWTSSASFITTDENGEKEFNIGEMTNYRMKLNSNESNWYGPAGKGNFGFGTTATTIGYIEGSIRLTNGRYNGNAWSPKYYRSGWLGGSRARITTYNISRIGKGLGRLSLGLGVAMDIKGVQIYQSNPNSPNAVHPNKAILNTVMGIMGTEGGGYGAMLSTLYFGVDNFYPGGWVGASETAARTEAYEQQMTGHPFFSNSAIKF
ncbi:RHS repeat-associated core domain-containing protein [uncultured Chryseobacterium sp.]|uniref:RHS repeat-associated core domain-containing protein n=1 Tax=uncultured Chryseobacterium sp. TaxID=259322 RepID=UPI0025CFDF35|nr:RHS repeat-associated core domain-containing protein [uncultured Chryseobacterium sp.]